MVDPETIYHWYRLDDRITTSGQPTETELADVAARGVRCVINLELHSHEKALRDEAATAHALAMTYVHIPVDFQNPTERDFDAFCRALNKASDSPVHVHCIANYRVSASSIATAAPSSAWMRHERELIWIGSGNLTLFGQRSSTERPLSDGAFPSVLKRRPICPMAQEFCRLCGKSDHADSAAALGAVASSMTHISGHDRSQMFLLPESVDDYVGVDNPVRFIDAFADELDLAAAGFVGVEPKATGRPGYAPADLKALHLWLSEPGAVEPEAKVGMPSEHRDPMGRWIAAGALAE